MTADQKPSSDALDQPSPMGSDGSGWTLKIVRRRWDAIAEVELPKAILTVVGAWTLLAWSRFGLQGLSAPRAGVRFVLVGVYAWIAMALILFAIGLARQRLATAPARSSPPGLTRLLQFVGLAHQPLVVGGFLLQFATILPIPFLAATLAGFTVGFWLPAMLGAAVSSMFDTDPGPAAALTAAIYLPWLASAGWYLSDRVGHLL